MNEITTNTNTSDINTRNSIPLLDIIDVAPEDDGDGGLEEDDTNTSDEVELRMAGGREEVGGMEGMEGGGTSLVGACCVEVPTADVWCGGGEREEEDAMVTTRDRNTAWLLEIGEGKRARMRISASERWRANGSLTAAIVMKLMMAACCGDLKADRCGCVLAAVKE